MEIVLFCSEWMEGPDLPDSEGRSSFASVAVNNSIYIFGGVGDTTCDKNMDKVFRLDTAAQTWRSVTNLPESRTNPAATVLRDKILVLGGYDSTYLPTNTSWLYSPVSNEWSDGPDLSSPRCQFAAVTIKDTVYIIGGYSHDAQDSTAATVETYSLAVNKWATVAPMNTPRYGHGAVVHGGKIFVAGGAYNSTLVQEIEMYDPTTNTWTAMAKPRVGAAMAIVQNSIFILGGTADWRGTSLTDVEVYHLDSNMHEPLKAMVGARYNLGAAVVGNVIYAIGGIHTIFNAEAVTKPYSTSICDSLVERYSAN